MATAVLLSGGVDSSLALQLLHNEGHELRAFYLKIWLEDDLAFLGDCPWDTDLQYTRAICKQLGVPLEIVPLQRQYFDIVVEHAVRELRAGRTPSPDILCNQHIKFGAFFSAIDDSFETVASGHYAQIRRGDDGLHRLCTAPDPVKDQTYFLARLNQQQLARIRFPIGHLQKCEVRKLAADFAIPAADRKDSQGICFLGKIQYRDFVKSYLGESPGPIVDADSGKVLGEHRGLWFHTIGQRQGLGLSGGPWYVSAKDMDSGALFVTHGERREQRARDVFEVADCHWIATPPASERLELKLRHGPQRIPCEIAPTVGGLRVRMAEADSGVAPGQYAIFYDGDVCLGAGVITEGE
jgi:tRNA (5-methylaminomethyl-2-thiouridylate)-methyltransferase